MADDGHANALQVIQGTELLNTPTRSRLRLNTVRECRRELIKVYAEARSGELETSTATRLAYLLQTIVAMIRDGDMEERIQALEDELAKQR